jgi:maltose O-acetyltransferase
MSASILEELRVSARRLWGGLPLDRAVLLRDADILLGIARARFALRGAQIGVRVYVGGPLTVVSDGEILVGDLTCFFGGMIQSELICHGGARLSIGRACELNYGVSIEAQREVRIGASCKIGSMVRIADASRLASGPVVLEDEVWLAHGVIVEPGVTIGRGSVVSAGSVVTSSIPADSLAIGNPARAVRLDMLAKSASR